jgi:hypothetical protein
MFEYKEMTRFEMDRNQTAIFFGNNYGVYMCVWACVDIQDDIGSWFKRAALEWGREDR